MVSQFDQLANAYAEPQRIEGFGESVKLRSGDSYSDAFTAWHSGQAAIATTHRSDDLHRRTKIVERAYYLPVASCVIGGSEVEPVAGMRIEHVDSGDAYAILPQKGTPAAEKVSGELYWRISAKKV